VKYTPPGGKIRVRVQAVPAGEEAVIQVQDNGVGISADILPHVFKLFARGDSDCNVRLPAWELVSHW
jgi:signal transduction histidine kinase